ncbi:MAG: hypothetical protein V3S55_13870 [Nitrospiraceae bacterium]
MAVDTTTYLADAKIIYGSIQDQVSTKAAIMNLFGDGSKFGKPINNIGIRGYVFLARIRPNWNLGYRIEGVTGVGAAGNQGLANATVVLKYAYVPITITGQAENLTKGESRAFMQAKALEAKYDMMDIVSHVNVVVAGANRGGELARVAAPAAGSFTADNAGGLPGAIYLRVNQIIDTMAVGGGAKTLDSATITAINYGTRVVTVPGTAVAGEAVALEDEYPIVVGNFPITAEGLISLISDAGAIQGLNPATAGEESWASYLRAVGGALSSSVLQELCQFVQNRGGQPLDMLLFPSAQINQYVAIATTTLRFNTDMARTAGQKKALNLGYETYAYGNKLIVEDKDLRPDRVFGGASEMMKKFEAIPLSLAEDEAGAWTRVSGASGIADAVMGLLRWYHNIGILQRSSWGVLETLTVPAAFATAPPTL